jgi:uncharacterized protein YlxW (UPF0749 family)
MNLSGLLRLATAGLLLFTIYKQHESIKALKASADVKLVDSLRTEVFSLQSEIGRYEMATEELKEKNPEAEKEFEEIIEKDTE